MQKQKAVEDITNLSIGKVPDMMLAEECHRSDATGKHALFVRRLREDNPETNPMKENPADAMDNADDAQSSDHEKTFSVMGWMLEAFAEKAIAPTWQLCCMLWLQVCKQGCTYSNVQALFAPSGFCYW